MICRLMKQFYDGRLLTMSKTLFKDANANSVESVFSRGYVCNTNCHVKYIRAQAVILNGHSDAHTYISHYRPVSLCSVSAGITLYIFIPSYRLPTSETCCT